jgi:LysR family glycine cleavage system transcriptional activator
MPFWKTDMSPIHYRDRGPWRHWLRAAGAPVAFAERGEVLHDPNLILKAAAHGRGIALGFQPFVDTLIADGQLIVASDIEVPAQHTYRVFQRDSTNSLAKNFIGWLHDQAALISGKHK